MALSNLSNIWQLNKGTSAQNSINNLVWTPRIQAPMNTKSQPRSCTENSKKASGKCDIWLWQKILLMSFLSQTG